MKNTILFGDCRDTLPTIDVKAANIANEDHWVEERLQHPHD